MAESKATSGGDIGTATSFKGELLYNAKATPKYNNTTFGVGVVLVGHLCFVFGGCRKTDIRLGIFNICSQEWRRLTVRNVKDLYGRVRMSFIVDDKLYAYVRSKSTPRDIFLTLDLVSKGEWLPEGIEPCVQLGFGSAGSYIEARREAVLFGGKDGHTDVYVYRLVTSSWYRPVTRGTPPTPRYDHTTCSQGQHLFVLGGRRVATSRVIRPLELHVLTMNARVLSWSTPVAGGSAPVGRCLLAAGYTSGKIFVFGGDGGVTNFDIYSLKQQQWQKVSYEGDVVRRGDLSYTCEWKLGASHHGIVVTSQMLLIFGGFQLPLLRPLRIKPV